MVGSIKERDCAVSAVIGVMLLLTIVIIMGALVAAFAGGMVDRNEKAPSVDLAIYTANHGEDHCIVFEHRGGDQIRIRDLRVNTLVNDPDGDMIEASHEGE
jgi:FlaG/FlaF family flagellin (archaellin)